MLGPIAAESERGLALPDDAEDDPDDEDDDDGETDDDEARNSSTGPPGVYAPVDPFDRG